ncbi:MAG: coproporphyrinogen III oxidase [Candidatus Hydrogenedentota bacterium]
MIGVYIHIPYCRTVCPYCDFVKRQTNGSVPDAFLSALEKEIRAHEGDAEADSIFLGGGTPSLLEAASLDRVLSAIRSTFDLTSDAEISLEANPDDVTVDLVHAWRSLGVTRVSLGVQSFDDRVLQYLGRRHDAPKAIEACAIVANAFDNWNIDLMFGAPPAEAWRDTLRICASMGSTHVSAYGLTYEAGTPFGKRKNEAIDDESYLDLYHAIPESLQGVRQYEVSNYAAPGFECRHNLRYWHNEEYAALGPGAVSFLGGRRARNHAKVEDYLNDPGGKCEVHCLTEDEIRLETLIQHFRLAAGLPKQYYQDRFGAPVADHYGDPIERLMGEGLLQQNDSAIFPTNKGFDLNNEIGLALVS